VASSEHSNLARNATQRNKLALSALRGHVCVVWLLPLQHQLGAGEQLAQMQHGLANIVTAGMTTKGPLSRELKGFELGDTIGNQPSSPTPNRLMQPIGGRLVCRAISDGGAHSIDPSGDSLRSRRRSAKNVSISSTGLVRRLMPSRRATRTMALTLAASYIWTVASIT
jgi:hypothetical protein